VPADHANRVKVLPDLSTPGHPEIFVIGDTATIGMRSRLTVAFSWLWIYATHDRSGRLITHDDQTPKLT
jgi:hypothetical protein